MKEKKRKSISPPYTVQCTIFDVYDTREATFKKNINKHIYTLGVNKIMKGKFVVLYWA